MPIERFADWGRSLPLPPDGIVVGSNGEALEIVTTARRAGKPLPTLGLAGGDLSRSLGATGDIARLRSEEAMTFEIDLGAALIDGRLFWFLAHLVARRSHLHGPLFAAMNADWLGDWNLAPRAHPGDGLLDVVDANLSVRDRIRARRRVRTGTHVPHPDISITRTAARQITFTEPRAILLDGKKAGRAAELSIRIEPAALTVVV